jgi:hypothetical protein
MRNVKWKDYKRKVKAYHKEKNNMKHGKIKIK